MMRNVCCYTAFCSRVAKGKTLVRDRWARMPLAERSKLMAIASRFTEEVDKVVEKVAS
jgi:hypothetical protein